MINEIKSVTIHLGMTSTKYLCESITIIDNKVILKNIIKTKKLQYLEVDFTCKYITSEIIEVELYGTYGISTSTIQTDIKDYIFDTDYIISYFKNTLKKNEEDLKFHIRAINVDYELSIIKANLYFNVFKFGNIIARTIATFKLGKIEAYHFKIGIQNYSKLQKFNVYLIDWKNDKIKQKEKKYTKFGNVVTELLHNAQVFNNTILDKAEPLEWL